MAAWTSCACAEVAVLPGADGPDRLVGHGEAAHLRRRRARRARRAPAGPPPRGSGPTRARAGSRRRRRWGAARRRAPARVFLRTASSVSPKNWRRSLWPTSTYRQPASTSMGAETSPVKAPCDSQCTFCAASPMRDPASSAPTAQSAVKGGATATSTRSAQGSAAGADLARQRARLGGGPVHLPVAADEFLPGHVHSSRTLTPGSSRPSMNSRLAPPPVETCFIRSTSPASSTAAALSPPPTTVIAARLGHGPGHAERALGPGLLLEEPHGAVPEDGLRGQDPLPVAVERLRADVEPHEPVGDGRRRSPPPARRSPWARRRRRGPPGARSRPPWPWPCRGSAGPARACPARPGSCPPARPWRPGRCRPWRRR